MPLDWNEYEDRQPSPSVIDHSWSGDQKFTTMLEVRQQETRLSMRLGEIYMRGTIYTDLVIRIGLDAYQE